VLDRGADRHLRARVQRLHGLGQTRYIDDISFPGMLYCKIKRAGIASALIKKINRGIAASVAVMNSSSVYDTSG
jgi:CO/xanthine dehydrogenase Mo-binding subunit